MNQTGKFITTFCAAVLLITGCRYIEEHERATAGAAIGAAAGGIAGGLYKGSKGAIVGGVLGALAGAAVGEYIDRQDESADETKETYNYDATEGIRIEALSAEANPDQIRAGSELNLNATYAVMAPNDQQEIQITETRTVEYNGEKAGELTSQNRRTSGTYTSTVPLELPNTAEAGLYTYTLVLQGASKETRLESNFRVTR